MSNHTRHAKHFTRPATPHDHFTTPPTSIGDAMRRARQVGGPYPVLDARTPLVSIVDDNGVVFDSWGLAEMPEALAWILNAMAAGDCVGVSHPVTGEVFALHRESRMALYLIVESILRIAGRADGGPA